MKMNKNTSKRIFKILSVTLASLLLSCNGLIDSTDESVSATAEKSVVRLSIRETAARTAYPDLVAADFTKISLYGKNLSKNESEWGDPVESWVTDEETSAVAKLMAASISVTKEKWAFKLTASRSGLEYADETTYVEGLEIANDVTNLSFTLVRTGISSEGLTGTGGLKVTVSYPENSNVAVKVTVQNGDDTEYKPETEIVPQADGKAEYTIETISAGQYKLIFKFYADDENGKKTVLVGTYSERAVVVDSMTSSSSFKIESFDATKSVTYKISETDSHKVFYSRQSPITEFDKAEKEGFVFCGWYTGENGTGDLVTISTLEDGMTLYAWFIANADVPDITRVALSGTVKVGNTLTASAKCKGSDDSEKDFEGTVIWQWYVGEDSDDEDSEISGDEWQIIEGATANSFIILPEYAGKSVKVSALKPYTVVASEDETYTATENTTPVDSPVTAAIEKGTLKDELVIKYSTNVLVGSSPSLENLTVTGTLKDDSNDAEIAMSVEEGDGGYTIAVPDTPLSSSCNITVTISVDGYDSITKNVFVTVQANEPTVELSEDTANIDDGKIAFANEVEGAVYSIYGGEPWLPITTEPFTPPESGGVVYVMTPATGEAGKEGYIAASRGKKVVINNNKHLGTKIEAIATVALTGEAKVGNTLSATVTGEKETDLTESENVTYQWYAASGAETEDGNAINGATGKAFTLTPAEAGKFIYVEATQTNPKTQVAQGVSSSRTEAVANGALNAAELTISYTENVVSGNAPSAEKLAAEGKLTGGTNTVEISQSAQAGDGGYVLSVPNVALTSSGKVTVTVSAEGYDSITKEAFVTVQAKAPETTEIPALSEEKDDISIGYIKFVEAAETLEYSTDGGENWHDLSAEEFEMPVSPNVLEVRVKASGTAETAGYIAPSQSVTVSVSDDNVGTKPIIKVTVNLGGDIKVEKTEGEETVILSAAEGYSSYKWKIDGKDVDSTTWASASVNTLTLTKADMTTGSYTVTVVGTKSSFEYTTSITVSVTKE